MNPPSAVLLVATREIGDVLLTTPLLRSMRRAWPLARIDVLVYRHKGGMLEGNPDCNAVIESDEHPDRAGYQRLLRRLFRRYDLAVTTQANDRGHLYSLLAARRRVGLIPDLSWQSAWKRALCASWSLLDNVYTHTVLQNLMLAERLGITPRHEVVPPTGAEEDLERRLPLAWRTATPYAVLHPYPRWRYKRWTDAGWRALLQNLAKRGWRVVLTGGPDPEEREYCATLATQWPGVAISLAGSIGFGALAHLLRKAGVYVGPDTATTHLAAACGTPTLALYGPSNPVKWGPWPANGVSSAGLCTPSPWVMTTAHWQRVGNVLLLQGAGECVPCREEGCDRHRNSDSLCLTTLPAARVIAALDSLLANNQA